jgi:saccharopine dehydrogenase-like NADP-dependent oxidoreductase
MKEKTMRYPGHIEIMRVLRHTGLFSEEPVEVRGSKVRPRDLLATLMFPQWTYQPGEEDLTVMRVIVEGTRNGRRSRLQWDMLDYFDRATQATSMSRTTAFPCTIVARMLARGEINMPGVMAPEILGQQPGMLERVLKQLEQRNVHFAHSAM